MKLRIASVLLLTALAAPSPAQTIPAGSTATTYSTVAGTNTLNAGDTHTMTGTVEAVAFNPGHTLVINGILETTDLTGGARAVRLANTGGTYTVTIGANGIVRAASNDAFQARNVGTVFNLTNNGQILGLNPVPNAPYTTLVGQALDLASAGAGTVVNDTGALIQADGHDAVRLGSGMTLTNNASIIGNGKINDSADNNNSTYTATNTFPTSEGVSFENAVGSSLINNGTISGTRHGVDGDTGATNISITNNATGIIIGKNGSGVGGDATSATASNVTIDNFGLIRGDYGGVGNIVDRSGTPSIDGDGDGVDIDGAATITNRASGIIRSTGAGGFDSLGRANNSEAISIGGGNIINNGLIEGAGRAIIVNNDTVISRSGTTATSITNQATGTITGLNGYAIRFENKLGTPADSDTIINFGTISGTGAIPNPSDIVLRQYGEVDGNSVGTLDGVTYTGTGSARFIRGDGAAIQTGEGADLVQNHGTITSSNGRAVSLEGGDDTLSVLSGTANISGSINGGVGTDTLNFDLGSATNVFSYSGAISNFEVVKALSGKTRLSGASTYAGTTEVGGGSANARLEQNGTHTGGDNITVKTTGTFAGIGTETLASAADLVTIDAGGTLAPGSEAARGRLTLALGGVVVNGGLSFLLDGTAAGAAGGYDQLRLDAANSGTFTLGAASTLTLDLNFAPALGTVFTLVDLQNPATTVSGTFASLAQNTVFTQDGAQFRISYVGGTGNDLTVTVVPEPSTWILVAGGLVGLGLRRRGPRARTRP